MRSLGFALLAVGLSSCTQPDPSIEEPVDVGDEEPGDAIDGDEDVVRDAGRRDAGRDAGRRRLDAGFGFPFAEGGLVLLPGDGGFDIPKAPPPPRLSLLMKSERPLPALSGGTLAVRGAGDVAVAADSDRDRIYVITLDGSKRPLTIQLEVGSEPGRVLLDSQGRAHVALRGAGQVLTLELSSGQTLARSPLCSLPRGLAHDAAQDALVVACAGGELVTVSAATHQPIASAELPIDLRDVLIGPDGTRLVSRYRSAELLRVDATGKVLSSSAPQPRSAPSSPGIEFLPDGQIVQKPAQAISSSPTLAWRTVAGGQGRALMLHQNSRDTEIDIGGVTSGGGGSYGGGCEAITTAAVSYFDGSNGAVSPSIQLAPHGLVVDVAVSPDGRSAAFAEPGGYLRALPTLEVIDLVNASTSFGAGLIVDGGVTGPTCVSGASLGSDKQTTAVAYDDSGKLYAFSREPAALQVYASIDPTNGGFTGLPDREILLALESVRDTGHELFHADVGSGMSCASCHGEGLDDGHVWSFKGFGPRRTQTMRGGLLSTLPLHWEGDLPTFQNLVDEVMTRRMGGFVVEPRFGDALAQWLDKLPPLKLGRAEDAAVQHGKALFESTEVACASCHSGTHLTNNETADVGTGGRFQVPTLLGIALHPPFLHDGCAQTLEERFDPYCGGGDAHGHTSQLTGAELADLVAYLKTL